MRQIAIAFAPVVIALVLGVAGVFSSSLALGAPALLCAFPITLWWNGFYLGRAGGTLQAPISFNGYRPPVADGPPLSDDERQAVMKYRQHRARRNDQVNHQVARELD